MVKYSHSQTKEKSKEVTFIYSSIKETGKNRLVGAIRRFSFICWSLLSPNRNLRDEIRIVSPLSHLLVLPSVLFYFCIFPKERTFHFKSIISLDWTPRQLAAVKVQDAITLPTLLQCRLFRANENDMFFFYNKKRRQTKKWNKRQDGGGEEKEPTKCCYVQKISKAIRTSSLQSMVIQCRYFFFISSLFFHITWKIQLTETDGSISLARSVFSDR